jgi:hypothetical protein
MDKDIVPNPDANPKWEAVKEQTLEPFGEP